MNVHTAYLPISLSAVVAALAMVSLDARAGADTSAARSRAEVKAETQAAMRANEIARNDADMERLANAAMAGDSRARAQVKADTRAAMAAGTIARNDAEFEAQLKSHDEDGMPRLRAEVVAETREAQRLGLIPHGERELVPTPEQAEAVRLAGVRAAEQAFSRASR